MDAQRSCSCTIPAFHNQDIYQCLETVCLCLFICNSCLWTPRNLSISLFSWSVLLTSKIYSKGEDQSFVLGGNKKKSNQTKKPTTKRMSLFVKLSMWWFHGLHLFGFFVDVIISCSLLHIILIFSLHFSLPFFRLLF